MTSNTFMKTLKNELAGTSHTSKGSLAYNIDGMVDYTAVWEDEPCYKRGYLKASRVWRAPTKQAAAPYGRTFREGLRKYFFGLPPQ